MRRALVMLAVTVTMTISPMQSIQAKESNVVVQDSKGITEMQRADVIVKRYRMHNDIVQYRRWNETRGCWVDPDWIDLG